VASQIEVQPGLYLLESNFGWLVSGRMSGKRPPSAAAMIANATIISTLWDLETLGIREPNLSNEKEEELALQQFYANISYDNDSNRYSVTWLWRSYPPPIPSNYGLAAGVLRTVLRRTPKNHLNLVKEIFEQQLASGIIERVDDDRIKENTHYLPYHFVINEEKSTPVRVVYNGSAKRSKTALSLNECLFKGTTLLPDLGILIHFPCKPIALVADVEKAFHQIELKERDRDYLRFLWYEFEASSQKLITYRFRRVPFGIISSPFILAAVIRYLLGNVEKKVRDKIIADLYVDKVITAVESLEEARGIFRQTTDTFAAAGMNLRLWTSNMERFVEEVPSNLREEKPNVSVLGIPWSRTADNFSLATPQLSPDNLKGDMREVLKLALKLFDPMSWIAPVSICALLILRNCHMKKYDWDSQLTESEQKEWQTLYRELQQANTLQIPRHIEVRDSGFQLHVFSDASKDVYAAAVYLRTEEKTDLVLAKARVAPLKSKLTIPWLELMAALIAMQLLTVVWRALACDQPAISWIDSKCVLYWLGTANVLPTFVRNRIAEIRRTPLVEF